MKNIIGLFVCISLLCGCASAQENTSVLKFGIFADTQYADCPSENMRFYREALLKLDICIDCFNKEDLQFIINLGDMIDRKSSDLNTIKSSLCRLNNKVYHITGNHDYKEVTDNAALYRLLDIPSEYYCFKKRNWVFVMLNTNEVASYANVNGTEKEQELTEMLDKIKLTGGKTGLQLERGDQPGTDGVAEQPVGRVREEQE